MARPLRREYASAVYYVMWLAKFSQTVRESKVNRIGRAKVRPEFEIGDWRFHIGVGGGELTMDN